MCMDEFVKRLYDFMGIYKNFWSQNSDYRYLPIIYRYLPIFFQKFLHKRACSTVAIFPRFFLLFFFSVPAENRFFGEISAEKTDFLFPGYGFLAMNVKTQQNSGNCDLCYSWEVHPTKYYWAEEMREQRVLQTQTTISHLHCWTSRRFSPTFRVMG